MLAQGYAGNVTQQAWIPQTSPGASASTSLGADRVLALDEIAGSLSGANERLHSLVIDARAHADSIFGSNPEKGEAGPVAPRQTGRIHGLRESVETTQALLAALSEQLYRLRGI